MTETTSHSSWETYLRAIERHLPLGIAQGYLPPDLGATPQLQPDRPILDLPTTERWKAELTLVTKMA